jgi:hypothetical protein
MLFRELRALGQSDIQATRLRLGRTFDKVGDDATEQIRLLTEQLAAAHEETWTCKEELASTKESVSMLESQLRTIRLEAEVDKLRTVEQVRLHGDE